MKKYRPPFSTFLPLFFVLLVGCSTHSTQDSTQLRMLNSSTTPAREQQITFPNGLSTGNSSSLQSVSLAQILVQSHNMAVQQRERMEETTRQGLEVSKQLQMAYERNQASAFQAYEMIRQKSARQGNSEITIFFPVNSAQIPQNSEEHQRLVRFADYLARESRGRAVNIVSVGSASAFGAESTNTTLAEQRAHAPIGILDHYLVKIPHTYHRIYGTGEMYSPQGVSMEEHKRYQHVHLVAFFEGEAAPSPEAVQPIITPTATPAPIPAPIPVPAAAAPAPVHQMQPAYLQQSVPTPRGGRFTNSIGMDFVLISPGTFTLGSPASEYGHSEHERAHQATLTRGFYMQTTEVTQQQWETIMGNNPSHFQICGGDCPVESISWYEAQQFLCKLNEMEGTNAYRLPTEAEWEYACRAGTTTAYSNGGGISAESCGYNDSLGTVGWYFRNSEHGTHPVAQKTPNAWGLYDMHGNVWEWCGDWQAKYSFSPVVDPAGPEKGYHKIRRGGSWSHYPMYCRSAYRSWYDPDNRTAEIGLRLVRDEREPAAPSPYCVPPAAKSPAPAPVPQPSTLPVSECIILHDVTFDLDSAEIRPAMVPVLNKVAEILKSRPGRIQLTGHTCSLASNAYNLSLSQQRAQTVRDQLIHRGIPAARITTRAMGESEPRFDNSTEAGRRLNRRVEIRLQ